jgi:hypothetical protein
MSNLPLSWCNYTTSKKFVSFIFSIGVIRKQLHKALYEEINKVKKDLITFGDLSSDVKYHSWIREQKIKIFPNKTEFEENNIYYELKSNIQYFIYGMFHICNEL